MLPKPIERARAIKLRYQGLSYSEIIKKVPVSQAVLSLWLRSIPLTIKQKERLIDISSRAGAQARRQQRLDRTALLQKEVEKELPQLVQNPFFMLGLALYWAEGTKQKPWNLAARVKFGNSDPNLLLLIREWFKEFCQKDYSSLTYRLYIHDTADIEKARRAWAKILGIKVVHLPYTLKHHKIRGRHMHSNYIGLVQVSVEKSTWLNRRIELWTRGVARQFLA